MPKKFYYSASLIVVFVVPALVELYFVLHRIPLFNLITFIVGITILGSAWDIWATRHGRRDRIWLWQFNTRETLGIRLLDLPAEEYLFYVASSLYVVLTWEGIRFALETHNPFMYFLLSFAGIWTILGVLTSFKLAARA